MIEVSSEAGLVCAFALSIMTAVIGRAIIDDIKWDMERRVERMAEIKAKELFKQWKKKEEQVNGEEVKE